MFIFNYCLEMRVDIHHCLPAECTSFLSMLGCSILYPGPIHVGRVDVKSQESLEEYNSNRQVHNVLTGYKKIFQVI